MAAAGRGPRSRPAAAASSSCFVLFTARTAVTLGCPSVMVPVLSITTVSIRCAVSSASPDLIRTPFPAPLPVPTIIATGVARPSAQGQEITSTEIAIENANSTLAPMASQEAPATRAITMTTGTNTPATRSASRAIGAFEAPASSTSRMIWLMVESAPTRCAVN